MFLRIEGIPSSFSLTHLSFLGTFSASVGTKMYVECTSSSFAVNRENWEGVVDEGREYIPVNEVVEEGEPREKEEELVIVMESAPPFPPMHLH